MLDGRSCCRLRQLKELFPSFSDETQAVLSFLGCCPENCRNQRGQQVRVVIFCAPETTTREPTSIRMIVEIVAETIYGMVVVIPLLVGGRTRIVQQPQ